MNNIDNWDIILKYELLKKDSLSNLNSDFGFKRLVNIANNYLYLFKDKFILDSTCGFGTSTNYLKELNFNVIGSDISAIAINSAKNDFKNVSFYKSAWGELQKNIPFKFDIIYNDCILWIYDYDILFSSLQGIFNSLNENGQFLFFGINAETDKAFLSQKLKIRFDSIPKEEIAWILPIADKTIECRVRRKLFYDFIEVEFCYTTKSNNIIINQEITVLKEVFKWTYDNVNSIFNKLGFRKIEFKKIMNDVMVIACK